jgi:hypothetical protein
VTTQRPHAPALLPAAAWQAKACSAHEYVASMQDTSWSAARSRWHTRRDQAQPTVPGLRLMDATPIPCGQSAVTVKRSDLFGWAGYGYCPSHSRWYWGCQAPADVHLRRDSHRVRPGTQALRRTRPSPPDAGPPAGQPPGPRHRHRDHKGLSGEDTEAFFASPDLGLTLVRPARKTRRLPATSRTGCGSGRRRRTSSASNATADASPPAYGPASSSGCWPLTPASGTTGR